MIEHKKIRSQASGEVVVHTSLLSAQKVSHGVCGVSLFPEERYEDDRHFAVLNPQGLVVARVGVLGQ